MPRYVISSDSPISARPITKPEWEFPDRPTDPGWGVDEGELGPGKPKPPSWRPEEGWERPEIPPLPPKDEWPPLPPWLQPGVGLPIPPTPEHPMVPVPPTEGEGGGGVDPDEEVEIWPPIRPPFELPDFSGKTLALALIYVSRRVAKWHWVVIDHEAAKDHLKALYQKHKDKLPAGGIGGRPPDVRPPGAQPR